MADYEVEVPPEVKEGMAQIVGELMKTLPEGWGFTTLLFQYGHGGPCVYFSTARREDAARVMIEFGITQLKKMGQL